MTDFYIPAATYRLQFHHGFRFIAAHALAPYLSALGITDIYASPLFRARRRSLHGYSVINPLFINPELGSKVSFNALIKALQSQDLGLILDIVPNHMALSHDNPWWLDVLENGPSSPYAMFFDIDWAPPNKTLEGRVLLPILGGPYGQVLENQELWLNLEEEGFFIHYYDHKFPLDPKTCLPILTHRWEVLASGDRESDPGVVGLTGLVTLLEQIPPRSARGTRKLSQRQRQKDTFKKRLWRLYQSNPLVREFIDENLRTFNGQKGHPASFDALDSLLRAQPYRLAYWQVAQHLINYRRFFSVNDLIGLRVEDPRVFEASHGLLFNLAHEGKITGVRVDHVDGLYDPTGYLKRLQSRLAEAVGGLQAGSGRRPLYVVVEKILAEKEPLPPEWPVAGTTGYDFLNMVNGVFIPVEGLAKLRQVYHGFIQSEDSLPKIIYDKKKLVMESLFGGELESLGDELALMAEQDRQARDISRWDLQEALGEVIVCLPLYRTYIRSYEVGSWDRAVLSEVIAEVQSRHPALPPAALEFLKRVLLLDFPLSLGEDQKNQWLRFVMRWQQFTGPIMAKGLEDTALYVYNPLVSLSEVGTHHQTVPPEAFHRFNRQRLAAWPYTMNATSTHDSKRGEDVRMRLNVLAELPEEWEERLRRWSTLNCARALPVNGTPVPDANQEYFLYQTLLGVWPLKDEELPSLQDRLQGYLVKAAREAKVHTRWIATHPEYEKALLAFAEAILEDGGNSPFLEDFREFQARLAYLGALNSLSQVLLKIASPGVPDFFQGTELWDLTLVDPDNRRPVDFHQRVEMLRDLRRREVRGPIPLIHQLLSHWETGAIKMFVTYKALNFRKIHQNIFLKSEYLPLWGEGENRERVVALARRQEQDWVVAVAGRFFAGLVADRQLPVGHRVWGKGRLILPPEAPGEWRNIFTGEVLTASRDQESWSLPLGSVFQHLPVALLHGSVVL